MTGTFFSTSLPIFKGVEVLSGPLKKTGPVLIMMNVRNTEFFRGKAIDPRYAKKSRWSAAAHAYNLDTRYDFQVLPGARHSFEHCMNEGDMGKMVFDFLFGGD
jgi:hypothetical protein